MLATLISVGKTRRRRGKCMRRTHKLCRAATHTFQIVSALLGILLNIVAVPAFADTVNWTGAWNTRWRDGGTVLELTQEGKKVTGAYPLYNGRIEAEVRGRLLVGDWIE